MNACHVCATGTDDACVRCERPTCPDHFYEQEHLGLCDPCRRELDDLVASGRHLTNWPYPLRAPLPPGWTPPAAD